MFTIWCTLKKKRRMQCCYLHKSWTQFSVPCQMSVFEKTMHWKFSPLTFEVYIQASKQLHPKYVVWIPFPSYGYYGFVFFSLCMKISYLVSQTANLTQFSGSSIYEKKKTTYAVGASTLNCLVMFWNNLVYGTIERTSKAAATLC